MNMQKKILTLLVLLVAAVSGAWADNTYEITATATVPGMGDKTGTLFVAEALPKNTTLADCYKAATGQASVPSSLVFQNAEVTSGYNLTLGTLDGWNTPFTIKEMGEGVITVTVAGLGSIPITISAKLNLTTTDYKTWTIPSMPGNNLELEVEYDTELSLDEVDDNSAKLDEWSGYLANITLTRKLLAGSWNTLAVPFNVSSTMLNLLKTSYGLDVKELTGSTLEGNTLTLNFSDATEIVAGTPYLVKVTTDFDFSAQALPNTEVSKDLHPVTTTYADFIPTLGKTTIEEVAKEDVLFVAAGNTLKNPAELPTDMKGFRAYFLLKNVPAEARTFALNIDGEATGIEEIENGKLNIENEAGAVYDLQGRRIASSIFNSQSSIQKKGVYIMNGKKIIK